MTSPRHRHTDLLAMLMLMLTVMACSYPVAGMSSWAEDEELDMDMKYLMMKRNPLVEMSSREELVDVAGYGEEKLSKVTISGKVVCHHGCGGTGTGTAADHAQQPHRPVSGASVAVFCGGTNYAKSHKSWARGTTDEYGEFLLDLPSHLHAIPNLEKVCLLKLLSLPRRSECSRPGLKAKHHEIVLQSIDDAGARAYAAHTINLTAKPSSSKINRKHRSNNRKHMLPVY